MVPRLLILAALVMTAGAGIARAEWQTFSTADGLPSNTVTSIIKDRHGVLWLATGLGLCRYDGLSWKTIPLNYQGDILPPRGASKVLEDRSGALWFVIIDLGVARYDGENLRIYTTADGLPSSSVYSILEDRQGALWFGTSNDGVCRYDGSSWRTFTTADGLVSNEVLAIFEDPSGSLWFGTRNDGVSRYDGTSWQSYTTADGLGSDALSVIFGDRSGNLWFGTRGGGASRYDGATWRTYTNADGLAGMFVYGIAQDRDGQLWFATSTGVSRYDGRYWETFTSADGLVHDATRCVIQDDDGYLWFGTSNSGLSRYDGSGWRGFTSADGLLSDNVSAAMEDRRGDLWVAGAGGLSRYDGLTWSTYTRANGLADNVVYSMLEDRQGDHWFGTAAGLSRFDDVTWRTYTTAGGLAGNVVFGILEDRRGELWFATDGGVSRFDGATWRTYTTADGLAGNVVNGMIEDRRGNLWFSTSLAGVSRFDGTTWRTFTSADGLTQAQVVGMVEDGNGSIWVRARSRGVSRYDGTAWRAYTTAEGLASDDVRAILAARDGALWFGTWPYLSSGGVSRFDGTTWRTYTTADGLAGPGVNAILQDRRGALWFAADGSGISRYDGLNWGTYTTAQGLANNWIAWMLEDHRGRLWFGGSDLYAGLIRFEPDTLAPVAAAWPRPPRVSTSTTHAIGYGAAYQERRGVTCSYSFDGSPWTPWESPGLWTGTGLADGEHVFAVKVRDLIGNVDATPDTCRFEIDSRPPVPVIVAPASRQAVRDSVTIRGTASDARFASYSLEVAPVSSGPAAVLRQRAAPVVDGDLGGWNTVSVPDGDYELRLSVRDTLGLTGTALVRVIVDNHAPWARVTSPARVASETGGDVYTTNAEAHLYIPPHGLAEDVVVTLAALGAGDVPATLGDGATLVHAGYRLDWGAAGLRKPATLEMSYRGVEVPAGRGLALYVAGSDSVWRRLGGTVEAGAQRISLVVSAEGRYALYAETGAGAGARTLSIVSLTPRVFSPWGTFANADVAIAFTLGRAADATVRIHNRAGRLVRTVAERTAFGAGANLVRWDGRDRDGALAEPGLYLVSVEALGETQSRPLAVVR